jgi:hypothetical protein
MWFLNSFCHEINLRLKRRKEVKSPLKVENLYFIHINQKGANYEEVWIRGKGFGTEENPDLVLLTDRATGKCGAFHAFTVEGLS